MHIFLLWIIQTSESSKKKKDLSVCLVWRRRELILIELSLKELILVRSEFDMN